jgi:hypothetical protein
MKIRKSAKRSNSEERDLTAHQRAILTATISDDRQNAWALEMLGRRNAVARWRGQPGCSMREIIQALEAMPA